MQPIAPVSPARPHRRRLTVLAVAIGALIAGSAPLSAQMLNQNTGIGRTMPSRGGGGGGFAAGAAIGLGLGVLGAIATQNADAADDFGDRRRPRRVRIIEEDGDGPVYSRRPDGDAPPRRRPPKPTETQPLATIQIPSRGETRYVPGEVLIELKSDRAIEPIARRFGLTLLESRPFHLTGSTLHRLRASAGRSTIDALTRLRGDRAIAFAQPNWLYTLQQDARPPEQEPAPQAAVAVPAGAPEASAPAPEAPVAAAPLEAAATAAPTPSPPIGEMPVAAPSEPAPAVVAEPVAPAASAPAEAPASAAAPSTPAGPIAVTAATPAATTPAPLPGQYAVEKLHLGVAHARARGRDVLVAVIDTGADLDHPELVGAVAATYDALEGADPAPGKHGTAMAGAVAARLRLSGTAPAARLLTARAFGPPAANGLAQGSTFHVAKCLDWAADQQARIVSMSFAGPADALLGRLLAAADKKGIVAVAAAGNAGPQSAPLHPAAEPSVVAVTASDAEDHILPAANRGAHILLTAPGVDVLVPAPRGAYDLTSGTSVAAAEVSGVAALLLEARADLKPQEVRRLLAETAVDLGAPGRDPIFGAGLVDAAAALARLR